MTLLPCFLTASEILPYWLCSVCRLLIKNGNNIESSTLYDSYEVEYLPNEGIVSTSRYLFIEFTTDGSGTNTGAAIRYEGMDVASFLANKYSTGLHIMMSSSAVSLFKANKTGLCSVEPGFFETSEFLEAVIAPAVKVYWLLFGALFQLDAFSWGPLTL